MKLKLGTAVVDGLKTVKLGYMRAGEPIGLEFEDGSVGYVLEAAAEAIKALRQPVLLGSERRIRKSTVLLTIDGECDRVAAK